ncbi:MAG: diacylglycerol kinase [Lentisphaeria bacterium]|nr:diacylglycerol kinase [Lentisphaeria bacterium]
MNGLRAAFRNESAFRQELALALFFIPFGLWIGDGATQKMFLIALVFLVLIVELLNSAVEAVVDRVGLEHHELSGRAKDLGSAAVMLCLFLTGVCFLYVSYLRFIA